jgi:hypothetical protein
MSVARALLFGIAALAAGGCTGAHGHGDSGGHAGGHETGHGGDPLDTGELDESRSVLSSGGTYTVSYLPDPDPIAVSENFAITLTVLGLDGEPAAEMENLAVDAQMPLHGHGMNVDPVASAQGDGSWVASPFKFHMSGWWEIVVTLGDGVAAEEARFHVDCCEG